MNDHGSLGLRWRVFPKMGLISNKSPLCYAKFGLFCFSGFCGGFQKLNDHGSLGLRWRVFPKMGLISNKSPLCCAKFGLFCFSGLLK